MKRCASLAINKFILTRGIILSEQIYQESSKIVHAYTEDFGKISIMAKGAHRPKSSLLSLTQAYSDVLLKLGEGKNFYYLQGGELLASNLALREDYEAMIYGALLLEIVERTTLEGIANEKIYGLLSKSLNLLIDDKVRKGIILSFCLKYISYMGYRPRLKANESKVYFDFTKGGTACKVSNLNQGYILYSQDIQLLNKLLYTPLDKHFLIKLDAEQVNRLMYIFIYYVQYCLEIKEFFSLQLI